MRPRRDLAPRKQPTQARARATHAAILLAAARILERSGYETLTTNHVANEAGVAIASLYEYFPNKQSIVAAVVTETVEGILRDLDLALVDAARQTPESGLRTWVTAMFTALDRRRTLVATLLREVPFLYEIPAMRAVRRRFFELAARGQSLGLTRSRAEHRVAVSYVLPLMVSSAVIEAVVRPPRGISRAEIESAVVDVLRPFFVAT